MQLPTTVATSHPRKLYFKTRSENKSIKTEKYNSICIQNNSNANLLCIARKFCNIIILKKAVCQHYLQICSVEHASKALNLINLAAEHTFLNKAQYYIFFILFQNKNKLKNEKVIKHTQCNKDLVNFAFIENTFKSLQSSTFDSGKINTE